MYDVIVIGSGPGGEGAAMQASKDGLRVALVEKMKSVGGSCTHLGTIPSKAIRQAALLLTVAQYDPLFREYKIHADYTFYHLVQRASDVISKQVEMRNSHYQRNRVDIFCGVAHLENANTVLVNLGGGKSKKLEAKNIVLAMGSRPYNPDDIDFTHPRIFDSDKILTMGFNPRTITVYGAGVVGCEYTSIFRSLGLKVNLINHQDKLLSFLDDEITDALSYHLRDKGVIIRHNEAYERIEARDDEVIVHLVSGKKIKSDALLFALGRRGNSENMGLEDLKLDMDHRGILKVTEHYQTTNSKIYAVGDLIGWPSLASVSYDQGRIAAQHIINPTNLDNTIKNIPMGIYTSPEISCIGKTETELTAAKIPYEVGHASFRHLARAQITQQTVGMLKILFHCQTLEILGIHCFGQDAAEIIHIGQAIMSRKEDNTLKYFINTTFNYPTMAEAYRVAALNGLNRLCS